MVTTPEFCIVNLTYGNLRIYTVYYFFRGILGDMKNVENDDTPRVDDSTVKDDGGEVVVESPTCRFVQDMTIRDFPPLPPDLDTKKACTDDICCKRAREFKGDLASGGQRVWDGVHLYVPIAWI